MVTFGAPAAHGQGFKRGGAKPLMAALSEHLNDFKDWQVTGILTPNVKVRDDSGRSRRSNSTTASLSMNKKGGMITLTTMNQSTAEIHGEPTRTKKALLEEMQSAFVDNMDSLVRLTASSSDVVEKNFSLITSHKESFRASVLGLLDFVSNFSDWLATEDESPQVLAEVIGAASLPQFESCLDELVKVLKRRSQITTSMIEAQLREQEISVSPKSKMVLDDDEGTESNIVRSETAASLVDWEDQVDRFGLVSLSLLLSIVQHPCSFF